MWFKITCVQSEQVTISIDELKELICDYNKRDFYFLDNRINFDISSLIIKKECLIGKFDHIKAVIFSKHAYLITDNFNFNDFQHFKEDSKSPCHLIILEFIFHQVLESFEIAIDNPNSLLDFLSFPIRSSRNVRHNQTRNIIWSQILIEHKNTTYVLFFEKTK